MKLVIPPPSQARVLTLAIWGMSKALSKKSGTKYADYYKRVRRWV